MGKQVAKLKVMCARSMHQVVGALTEAFRRDTGHAVELSFGTVGALQSGSTPARPPTCWCSAPPRSTSSPRPAPSAAPTQDRNHQRRHHGARRHVAARHLDARRFQAGAGRRPQRWRSAMPRSAAGRHPLAKLFVEMGLADAIARKGMPQQSGGEVANRVASGEADIGMTLIAEIVPIQGAHVIGPLPAPLGNDTTYAGAVTAGSTAKDAAQAFIGALTHALGARRLGGEQDSSFLSANCDRGRTMAPKRCAQRTSLACQLQAGRPTHSFRIVSIQRISVEEREHDLPDLKVLGLVDGRVCYRCAGPAYVDAAPRTQPEVLRTLRGYAASRFPASGPTRLCAPRPARSGNATWKHFRSVSAELDLSPEEVRSHAHVVPVIAQADVLRVLNAEGDRRWRNDRAALEDDVERAKQARDARAAAERERYEKRLKSLTWENLLEEAVAS